MTYQETEKYIFEKLPMYSRVGSEAYKKDLTNIRKLCDFLGNPQDRLQCIHIGGTNGKGSVSHYTASVLTEMGYKTGLYTSPHLVDYRERIKVDGKWISKDFVGTFVEKTKPLIEEISPSFFEITVAMALDYFAAQKVDFAVIEVGLGGRLDSTNIIKPLVSAITNISRDHTQMLGETLTEIAAEKAGIIKPNAPIVIGESNDAVKSVFEHAAKQNEVPIAWADVDWALEHKGENYHFVSAHSERANVENKRFVIEISSKDFPAHYAPKNIRTVLAVLENLELGQWIMWDKKTIENGFENVQKNTGFFGRFSRWGNTNIILDCAHNEAGMEELNLSLNSLKYNKLCFIFGCVKDKDIDGVLKKLPQNIEELIVTHADIPRAMAAGDLAMKVAEIRPEISVKILPNPLEALTYAQKMAEKDDLILVAGSVFLVGEVLGHLNARK